MATTNKIGDNLVAILKQSVTDLENFQLQLALGKAEAADEYEKAKKSFHSFLHEAKLKYLPGKQKATKALNAFEELQVQLALGKADSIDLFTAQKKKIMTAVSKLEKFMAVKAKTVSAEVEEELRHELEKFRIKLEVLRVQYELGRMDARDEFESRKHEFADAVAKLRLKFNAATASQKRQERHDELKKAYRAMKKTFSHA
jgi:hypothetical protein